MDEPTVKRAVAFFDGQNLYRHAKEAFGHHHPNYHPTKLFDAVCAAHGWENRGVRFYTGTPDIAHGEMWHGYWKNRLLAMRRGGILVTDRPIKYREREVKLPDGTVHSIESAQEKGIDLRIGLDIVRLAHTSQYDVGVIFSQDQDLSEVVQDVKDISRERDCWLKIVSAFPAGPNASYAHGIHGADWFKMDQNFYDSCLDSRDYRPKKT